MCGIFCSISPSTGENNIRATDKCTNLLRNRGPDAFHELKQIVNEYFEGLFRGFVLWTQGSSVTQQPFYSDSGKVLLWNGDVYDGLDVGDEGDTVAVFEALCNGVTTALCHVLGPYSFVFWDGEKLWFGRDALGRNSLLWQLDENHLTISSVSSRRDLLTEVPALGIFCLDVTDELSLKLLPWSHTDVDKVNAFNVGPSLRHEIISRASHIKCDSLQLVSDVSLLKSVFSSCDDPVKCLELVLTCESWKERTNCLISLLRQSIAVRVNKLPQYCKNCISSRSPCSHPKVGILFSGGLDSTVVAIIADEFVPEGEAIELYNVAFERKSDEGFDVPDRVTGKSSLQELISLAPHRTWNFIEIDVSQKELERERQSHIADLIHPLNSVLDDSLGCAMWFASRGQGSLVNSAYSSSARVVLLGTGADELLGGYRSARRAWLNSGWDGVSAALTAALRDIPVRNLGRDNRVVCDHSVTPRLPFLHEPLVSYLSALPPWQRCYLEREAKEGVGDKLLLRLAAWSLGLRGAALLPKRALQFGSRIANPKEKGHLPSSRLSIPSQAI